MIRVLVAEDSAVTRAYLVHLLRRDPLISVVGTAVDGREAVALAAALRPDVILMDVHMPLMNGYQAARAIMEQIPTPIVMASSSSSGPETRSGFRALEAGALVLLDKPPGPDHPAHAAAARELVQTLKLMAEVKVVRRWAVRPAAPAARPPAPVAARPPRVVAIGASTGGPTVVARVLRELPADLAFPVLVVQHIGAGFTAGFAGWLDTTTALRVRLPEHGRRLEPGCVYVAPGRTHLGVAPDLTARLSGPSPADRFCPSVSHLFDSVARACGPAAVGVLLTGMGSDGADGLRTLRDAGALTIAQDEASSVVFGMPAEAIRLEAATLVLPPHRIAETVRSLAVGVAA